MVYNPIFEEEIERKKEFKQLRKEIKSRHRHETVRQIMDRVYNLLKKKPVLTLVALFHPLVDMFRTIRAKQV